MAEKPSMSAGGKAMLAAQLVNEQARSMLIEVGGPLGWNDTRESWRARLARSVGINPRRVRSILSREKIRLGADEYLLIVQAHRKANNALEEISDLESQANLSLHRLGGRSPSSSQGEG